MLFNLFAFNHSFIQLFILHKQFIKQTQIMRKVTNYLWMFMMAATVLFVTSCGEDTEIDPSFDPTTIEFERGGEDIVDTTAAPGETITFDINVDFDEDRGTLNLIVTDGDDNEVGTTRPLTTDPIQVLQTTYEVPEDASGTIVLTASLEDADGTVVASEDFTINIVPPTPFTTYSTVLLAAPTGDETSKSFFSTSDGKLYSFGEVVGTADPLSEDIDFGYFYGRDLNATLSSPDEWPDDAGLYSGLERWGTKNDTDFRTTTLGEADFDAYENGNEIAAEFDVNSGTDVGGRVSNLAAGDVIAFSTADDRFGLIEVVSITGTDGSDGRIEINVKVTDE